MEENKILFENLMQFYADMRVGSMRQRLEQELIQRIPVPQRQQPNAQSAQKPPAQVQGESMISNDFDNTMTLSNDFDMTQSLKKGDEEIKKLSDLEGKLPPRAFQSKKPEPPPRDVVETVRVAPVSSQEQKDMSSRRFVIRGKPEQESRSNANLSALSSQNQVQSELKSGKTPAEPSVEQAVVPAKNSKAQSEIAAKPAPETRSSTKTYTFKEPRRMIDQELQTVLDFVLHGKEKKKEPGIGLEDIKKEISHIYSDIQAQSQVGEMAGIEPEHKLQPQELIQKPAPAEPESKPSKPQHTRQHRSKAPKETAARPKVVQIVQSEKVRREPTHKPAASKQMKSPRVAQQEEKVEPLVIKETILPRHTRQKQKRLTKEEIAAITAAEVHKAIQEQMEIEGNKTVASAELRELSALVEQANDEIMTRNAASAQTRQAAGCPAQEIVRMQPKTTVAVQSVQKPKEDDSTEVGEIWPCYDRETATAMHAKGRGIGAWERSMIDDWEREDSLSEGEIPIFKK